MRQPLPKMSVFREVVIDHERIHAGFAHHQRILNSTGVVQPKKTVLVSVQLANEALSLLTPIRVGGTVWVGVPASWTPAHPMMPTYGPPMTGSHIATCRTRKSLDSGFCVFRTRQDANPVSLMGSDE